MPSKRPIASKERICEMCHKVFTHGGTVGSHYDFILKQIAQYGDSPSLTEQHGKHDIPRMIKSRARPKRGRKTRQQWKSTFEKLYEMFPATRPAQNVESAALEEPRERSPTEQIHAFLLEARVYGITAILNLALHLPELFARRDSGHQSQRFSKFHQLLSSCLEAVELDRGSRESQLHHTRMSRMDACNQAAKDVTLGLFRNTFLGDKALKALTWGAWVNEECEICGTSNQSYPLTFIKPKVSDGDADRCRQTVQRAVDEFLSGEGAWGDTCVVCDLNTVKLRAWALENSAEGLVIDLSGNNNLTVFSAEGQPEDLWVSLDTNISEYERVRLQLVGGIISHEGRQSAFWKHPKGWYYCEDRGDGSAHTKHLDVTTLSETPLLLVYGRPEDEEEDGYSGVDECYLADCLEHFSPQNFSNTQGIHIHILRLGETEILSSSWEDATISYGALVESVKNIAKGIVQAGEIMHIDLCRDPVYLGFFVIQFYIGCE